MGDQESRGPGKDLWRRCLTPTDRDRRRRCLTHTARDDTTGSKTGTAPIRNHVSAEPPALTVMHRGAFAVEGMLRGLVLCCAVVAGSLHFASDCVCPPTKRNYRSVSACRGRTHSEGRPGGRRQAAVRCCEIGYWSEEPANRRIPGLGP